MAKIELESRVKIRAMDLKNTNQKLEEQKELLQTIIDHIPVIVTLCDSHGKDQAGKQGVRKAHRILPTLMVTLR